MECKKIIKKFLKWFQYKFRGYHHVECMILLNLKRLLATCARHWDPSTWESKAESS